MDARPFQGLHIYELAKHFADARMSRDVNLLRVLDAELSHRKSRRAKALAGHVRRLLKACQEQESGAA